MALPATETFTAASDAALQTYSANWTINAGAFNVNAAGDFCYPNANGSEGAAHWNADTFSADQYAQAAINNAENDAQVGVAVRCAASGATYYALYWGPNYGAAHAWLFKQVSGTWTQLAETDMTLAAGDVLRLEISGTMLTSKKNGTNITALSGISDNSISSGYAGIAGYDDGTTARIDDWEGGNLGGGAPDIVIAQVARPRRHFVIDSWR